jgi:hypothetical protein
LSETNGIVAVVQDVLMLLEEGGQAERGPVDIAKKSRLFPLGDAAERQARRVSNPRVATVASRVATGIDEIWKFISCIATVRIGSG